MELSMVLEKWMKQVCHMLPVVPVRFHLWHQSVHSGRGQQHTSHFHLVLLSSIRFGNQLQSVFWNGNWTWPCGHIPLTSVSRTLVSCLLMWNSIPISCLIPILMQIQRKQNLCQFYPHIQMRSSLSCVSVLECWAVPDMGCCSTWWCRQCRWCQQSIWRWQEQNGHWSFLCPFPDMMSISQMEVRHTSQVDLCQSLNHILIGNGIRIPMRRCLGLGTMTSILIHQLQVHLKWHRVWLYAGHTILDWQWISDTFRRMGHSFQQEWLSLSIQHLDILSMLVLFPIGFHPICRWMPPRLCIHIPVPWNHEENLMWMEGTGLLNHLRNWCGHRMLRSLLNHCWVSLLLRQTTNISLWFQMRNVN